MLILTFKLKECVYFLISTENGLEKKRKENLVLTLVREIQHFLKIKRAYDMLAPIQSHMLKKWLSGI